LASKVKKKKRIPLNRRGYRKFSEEKGVMGIGEGTDISRGKKQKGERRSSIIVVTNATV